MVTKTQTKKGILALFLMKYIYINLFEMLKGMLQKYLLYPSLFLNFWLHSSLPVSIYFKWSFTSLSSSLKKSYAQCCLTYFIPNSEWYQIEPLHLQRNKKKVFKNHVLFTYSLWLPCIYSVICFQKEIIISSDSKHSGFQCVFCNFFPAVGWSFFLGFVLVWFFFGGGTTVLFVGERKWAKINGCLLKHLHYYLWTGSTETNLCEQMKLS